MEVIEVIYQNTKAGTYVQFKLPVNSCELGELNAYDKYLQKQISEEFRDLIEKFSLDFSTDSSYLIHDNGKSCLMICLQGTTTPELERELKKIGVEKWEFL